MRHYRITVIDQTRFVLECNTGRGWQAYEHYTHYLTALRILQHCYARRAH